jgi:hypothetical protein
MTRDEIMVMEAGREMDAMVNEYIIHDSPCVGVFYSEEAYQNLPHYSTDISAAWEVVEKMSNKEITIYHQLEGMTVEQAHWDVEIDGNEGLALTAPLAICRAALITVTEGEE